MFKAIKKHFTVNNTIRELEALSNRELNDLGIARPDIRRIARGATTTL